jgi:hypothetical protein
MLFPSTKNLIATAQNPHKAPKDVDKAAEQFFASADNLSKAEMAEQMTELAKHFGLADVYRGAFLAMVCGALVERGCDPQPMAGPLRAQLKIILEACGRLVDACLPLMPAASDDDVDDDEESDDEEQDVHSAAFEEARRKVAAKMQAENNAWESLNTWWRPAIAAYSVSDMARLAASGLRPLAQKIAPFHPGGHWLSIMLGVLHEEPILVLEPATGLGIAARISGLADNFQLHTLLMESFPSSGIRAGTRVPRFVAEIARGVGPQQAEETVTGFWNLYNWQAVQANGELPPADDFTHSSVWIWNEGCPADIPQFEGQRVVLLGPPSLERSWNAMRIFESLPASLKIEKNLSSEEVRSWLQKFAAAKK